MMKTLAMKMGNLELASRESGQLSKEFKEKKEIDEWADKLELKIEEKKEQSR